MLGKSEQAASRSLVLFTYLELPIHFGISKERVVIILIAKSQVMTLNSNPQNL
jgi:hypothetical protein